MAITTYTELKASIADFLNRDDLTSVIPDFIAISEAQMQREIRHYSMEKRSTAEVDTRFSELPSDFLEPIRMHLEEQSTRLELISLDDMLEFRDNNNNATGLPTSYAITGGAVELYPTPDEAYNLEMVYYSDIDKLSGSNSSNWLLEKHPDVYLYGALVQSAPYLKDDARMQVWSMLYAGAVQSINTQSNKAKYGGSGLRLKIRSY